MFNCSNRCGRGAASRLGWGIALAVFLAAAPEARAVVVAEDLANYRLWGALVANDIERELRRPSSHLYAELTNTNGDHYGGINGNAFIWAASIQFRVRNSVYAAAPSFARESFILQMSDELHQRYWTDSADGQNGYVVAPGSTERYYDDNAHMTVALMEAYELVGDQRLLDRAIATHEFVLEGEDSFQGGGIYFREGSGGNKNTISTLQEARGAAMIYQATGEQQYLDDALRLLEWTNSHVQQSDGLYYQEYRTSGIDDISNVSLTNGAGMGILTNLEMFDITRDVTYLIEAQRVGLSAARRFRDTSSGSVWGGGYWAFELVDAWVDLYQHDGSTRWLTYASDAVAFLKENIEDDNGHYGQDWHAVNDPAWPELGEWALSNQASVARAYLYTGLAEAPAVAGDYNDDGRVDAADYTVWRDSLGAEAGTLPNDYTGEPIGEAQYTVWRSNFGKERFTLPSIGGAAATTPEPAAAVLLVLGGLAATGRRRR